MAINLTDKLYAATGSQVIADAIQVAGGYMAITSDQRANLTSAQKVAGTLVYETDTNKTYRYIETAHDTYEWIELVQKQGDWNQNDEIAPDYVKNRTHYVSKESLVSWNGDINGKVQLRGDGLSQNFYKISDLIISKDSFNKVELSSSGTIDYIVFECSFYNREDDSLSSSNSFTIHKHLGKNQATTPYLMIVTEPGDYEGIETVTLWDEEDPDTFVETSKFLFECVEPGIYAFSADYMDEYVACISKETVKPIDEKYIPDSIARVDRYDKYDKDSFSANDTAKAISINSSAFGFNTQAGSYAFTVLDLDATNKTFTLDSTEGLAEGDIYTADIFYYNSEEKVIDRIFLDYGSITDISGTVVTVDVFPSEVVRHYKPEGSYVDENGYDNEDNTFRVIAKPDVGSRLIGMSTFAAGNRSQAHSKNATAFGLSNVAYGAYSIVAGHTNKAAHGAIAMGASNHAKGSYSTVLGDSNVSSGNRSVAVGQNNKSVGTGSVSLGVGNESFELTSVAIGNKNKSNAESAVALGYQNEAKGMRSIALGQGNTTNALCAVAIGYKNTSNGEGSAAIGKNNTTNNNGAFAAGQSNTASGTNSTALGLSNQSIGNSSFTVGYKNTTNSANSVAIGTSNVSDGSASVAIGALCQTKMAYSMAQGQGAIAAGPRQFVHGRYNLSDDKGKYAHIIGNGTDDQNRKNIYTLDWNGNAWFAGSIEVATLQIPTTSNGTTYGKGTNGQILRTNGNTIYWGDSNDEHTHSITDIEGLEARLATIEAAINWQTF